MGGTRRADANSPANLVLVHGSATTGCHGEIEANPQEAARRGFRLGQWADPTVVPILYAGGVWVRLGHAGEWRAETVTAPGRHEEVPGALMPQDCKLV